MQKTTIVLAAVALLAAPLSGCIENMGDFKDRIAGKETTPTPDAKSPADLTKTAVGDNSTTAASNKSLRVLKPPVARMTIFAPGGALVYRASFVAENQTSPIVTTNGTFTFLSEDSEAVTGGARLVKFAWEVDGKKSEGRKSEANLQGVGVRMVKLTVTDSDGLSDSQMVHLALPPQPFTVRSEMAGGTIAGTPAQSIESEEHPFEVLAEVDGKKVKPLKLVVTLVGGGLAIPAPDPVGPQEIGTSQPLLILTDPEGKTTSDDAGEPGATASLTVTNPAAGKWIAKADSAAGGSDKHSVIVEITYVEIIAGLGDGHGHNH